MHWLAMSCALLIACTNSQRVGVATQVAAYAMLTLIMRVSLTRALLRAMAPLRETAASTGGIAPVLQSLSSMLAAPFAGSTIAVRHGGGMRFESVNLGRGSQAQALLVRVPSRSMAPHRQADGADGAEGSHHVWIVNVQLGTTEPQRVGAALCNWLDADVLRAYGNAVAVVLCGERLFGCTALTAWGAGSCRLEAHASEQDVLVKALSSARVNRVASEDSFTEDGAPTPLGLAVELECVRRSE